MLGMMLLKLGSGVVSIWLAAGILARDHSLRSNRLIAAFLLCNTWWAVTEFLLFKTTDPVVATAIFRWMSIGWIPLGVLCMHASLTLSSLDSHPISRLIKPLYASVGLICLVGIGTDFVIVDAEPRMMGWRPVFGLAMVPAYLLVAVPVLATLVSWRGVMILPESGGRLLLARVVFFGLSGALIAGTMAAIVLPLMGLAALGITTTLVAGVGLACAWTLQRFGHSLISPRALAREILDTLEDGVILVGETGIVRDANRAFLGMVGRGEAETIGSPITQWIPGLPERWVIGESSAFLEIHAASGEAIPVVASAPVELHGDRRFVGRAYLLRDRREIVSLQRRLIVAARLAAVGDLSKSISRAINEPVAQSREELEGLAQDWGSLEALLDRLELDAVCEEATREGQELISECVEGVDRISSIVREISGFSSESSREKFARHRLGPIVARALRVARVHAPAWLQIEDRLETDIEVVCHAEEIERVITNLLVNAIQALDKNVRGDAHLAVAIGEQSDRVFIHVEDDGCGIEPEVLDRIFDPFFTTKPVGKGTGLGLAISYHIVKDHGGDIRVSSVPGRGTSVTVDLPRCHPHEFDEDRVTSS